MINAQTPPSAGRAAGLEINCNALDRQQFIDPKAARQAQNRLCRQRLGEHLHRLGPSPLGHFIEIAIGADVTARLECYAEIDVEFVRELGGDKFAPIVLVIDGGAR
jgi:hypothetical protein